MPRITNPLPQLIPQRMKAVRRQLDDLVWSAWTAVDVRGGPVNATPVPIAAVGREKLAPVEAGSHFGAAQGDWQQRWFRIDVPAVARAEKGRRHLEWKCQGESTAWIDGEPWAGLECAHPTCPLPDRACTVWVDCGTYATGLWAPGFERIGAYGVRFDGVRIGVRDQAAWDAVWDMDVLQMALDQQLKDGGLSGSTGFGFLPTHDRLSTLTRQLLRACDDACDAFVAGGIPAFAAAMKALFARFPAETWQPVAALCGHAHIDLVWLWPEMATERKGIHTFATMLRLMERYPELRFSQSQPALYRAIERLTPDLHRAIRRRIGEGRWEAMGGFEAEPDTNLPSGEALARSLAVGQRELARLRGGQVSTLCWIPDVFGYSACLPQILRLGGVSGFYTTKMTWSSITRFPYNSFVWRGNDGSEVITHLCTTGYNGAVEVETNVNALRDHRQADVHPAMLLPQGYGDGGGGVTEQMCERARRLADLAGNPRHRWTRAEDFFADLAKIRARLPVYQGELYLEYHRATFTTQSEFKRLYRAAERGLQIHEAVRVVVGGGPVDERAWQRVAFAQFHDAIPGSSISLVYAQLNPELQAIGDTALAAAARELGEAAREPGEASPAAAGRSAGVIVFNPLPIARTVVAELPSASTRAAASAGGSVLTQRIGTGRTARTIAALTLAGLAGQRLPASASSATAPSATRPSDRPAAVTPVAEVTARVLDNGLLRAEFTADGRLAALIVDGRPLAIGDDAGLRLYDDHPSAFDAWDVDHACYKIHRAIALAGSLEVIERGPVRAVLRGEATISAASSLTIDYILEAGSRWLRIELSVEWRESHRLLKYHVPTAYRGRWARFGAPFGSIQRPQAPGVPADEAMWEVPAQRWAAVTAEDGVGLALVSEAKYGFSCKDGDLGLTLLRAPKDPDPNADLGAHRIRFAVGRHEALTGADGLSTAACADALFTPALAVMGGELPAPPLVFSDLGSLVPSWVLPEGADAADTGKASKGFVIRLHETNGGSGTATLALRDVPASVAYVDFLGNVLGKPKHIDQQRYAIAYTPYQIVSVRVR